MGNFENGNGNTTFEAHLMSLRFKDRDKSYDNEKEGLQLIQPGRIEETNGNGPVEPNLQTEISVNTADESMDIPQLSVELLNAMKENRAKYRSKVHYTPKEQALEEDR